MPKRARIVMLAAAILLPSLVTWAYFIGLAGQATFVQQAAYAIGKCAQFALPIAWWLAVERRWPKWSWGTRRAAIEGALAGLAIAAAAWLLHALWLLPTGFYEPAMAAIRGKVAGLGLATPGAFLAAALFYSLVHSLMEEYYWRWFVFGQLRRVLPLGPAIALSSLGFALHHVLIVGVYFGGVTTTTALLSLAVAIGGAYWAWLYERSGSLLGPWLSHAAVDAAIFAIGFDLLR